MLPIETSVNLYLCVNLLRWLPDSIQKDIFVPR